MRHVIVMGAISVAVLWVSSTAASLKAERDRWGVAAEVAVLVDARDVGETIDHDVVEFVLLPVNLVPDDAVRWTDRLDEIAAGPLHEGDVLRQRDLVGDGALVVPEGQRAIAIPLDASVPLLTVGDRVDLFVFEDAFGPVASSAGAAVKGRVVQLNEDAVVIAVVEDLAQHVAAGVVNGKVILAAA